MMLGHLLHKAMYLLRGYQIIRFLGGQAERPPSFCADFDREIAKTGQDLLLRT